MASPELIKRLSRETKVQILVGEACACEFATSELAELLDILAADPGEKAALSVAVLGALASSGTPAGRIEDLRKAFGAPPGAGRTTVQSAGAKPPGGVERNIPIRGLASQQTREVQSPFRARFDAVRPGAVPPPVPVPPAAAEQPAVPAEPPPRPAPAPGRQVTATGAPPAPRAPLPLRGKAAEILKGGTSGAAGVPVPSPAPPPPAVPVPPRRTGVEPAVPATAFFGDSRGKPSAEAMFGVARPMVLIADDDKRIRMVFRLKLEEKGYGVVEAADGQEAWKRLQVGGICAAVLDMKMPGLHGLEILSRLADSGQNLPVVICTAYDRMDDEFVVATYPKLRYLTKPVDGEQLAETLTNLLAE